MNVAAYIRVSTDEQAEHGISLDAQKTRLISYCKSQGWDICKFYHDDGYSGKNLERPHMQQLIQDCINKKIQVVAVLKLDRLSRRQRDVLHLLEDIFEANGVGFKSVTEPFDTTTPFGKAAIGMMAVFAQLERETIVERVKIAKKEAATQGRYMGGLLSYGYEYDIATKTVSVVESEANIVKFIFNEYRKGIQGYQGVADSLNIKHIDPPRGAKDWGRGTIRMMLENPFYAGYIEYEDTLYLGKHDAIIKPDIWKEVQSLKSSKRQQVTRKIPKTSENLLTGIIYCGECGARVRYKEINVSRKNKSLRNAYYVCYSYEGTCKAMIKSKDCKCGHKRVEVVEDYVVNYLTEIALSPTLLSKLEESFNQSTNNQQPVQSINKLNKELIITQKKIDRWYEGFEKGNIESDDLMVRVKGLREHKSYIEQKINELESEIKKVDSQKLQWQEVLISLKEFPELWNELTILEKRALLQTLVKSVKIYKDDRIDVCIADGT